MPRWLAPVLGFVIAFALAMKQILNEGDQDFSFAIIFAALGLFGGLLLLVADQTKSQRQEELARSPGSDPQFRTIARVLALIALVVSILPIVGFLVSTAALASNIRRRGWPRIVSCIALAISIGMLVLLFGNSHGEADAEQACTGQPATRTLSKSEGSQKPQPEAEGHSR